DGADPGSPGPRRAGGVGAGRGSVRTLRASLRPTALALLALLPVAAGCSSQKKAQSSTELLLNERMAAVLLRQGRARAAEEAYRDVLRSNPKKPDLHDGLGLALVAQGKVHESLDSFDRAIKLDSERALYRIHRGMVRTQLGRYGEAEEDFKVAERSPSPED